MKVHMYGGALTLSYNMAKALRKKGVDVTLFTDRVLLDKSYSPAWEDRELDGKYPGWIKVMDAVFSKALLGDSASRRFVGVLTDCDILHLHGEAYLWANLFSKPFIFHSYGYDLDQLPFNHATIKQAAVAYLCRRGIRKASKIIAAPHQRVFLEKLGVVSKSVYLPFPIDIDKYKVVDSGTLRAKLLRDYGAEYIFFQPTRHEWTQGQTTNNKGNDKLVRAFSEYLKQGGKKAVLVFINKGRDAAQTRKLISGCGIERNVLWLEPMPKDKLIKLYNASDIVFDQFNLGWFGQIVLEAMACGKPTMAYIKRYEGLYDAEPPIINVREDSDIVRNLMELTSDKTKLDLAGRLSREWVKRYHDTSVVCDAYIALYNKLYESN